MLKTWYSVKPYDNQLFTINAQAYTRLGRNGDRRPLPMLEPFLIAHQRQRSRVVPLPLGLRHAEAASAAQAGRGRRPCVKFPNKRRAPGEGLDSFPCTSARLDEGVPEAQSRYGIPDTGKSPPPHPPLRGTFSPRGEGSEWPPRVEMLAANAVTSLPIQNDYMRDMPLVICRSRRSPPKSPSRRACRLF